VKDIPLRVYQYVGLDETRKPTRIQIDMCEVIAIHERGDVVYVEGSGICWTLRTADVVLDDLYGAWYRARDLS